MITIFVLLVSIVVIVSLALQNRALVSKNRTLRFKSCTLMSENRTLIESLDDYRAAIAAWESYAAGLEQIADSIRDMQAGLSFVDTPLPIGKGKSSTQMTMIDDTPVMVIPEFVARNGKTVSVKNGNGHKTNQDNGNKADSGVSSEGITGKVESVLGDKLSDAESKLIAKWESGKGSHDPAEYATRIGNIRKAGKK